MSESQQIPAPEFLIVRAQNYQEILFVNSVMIDYPCSRFSGGLSLSQLAYEIAGAVGVPTPIPVVELPLSEFLYLSTDKIYELATSDDPAASCSALLAQTQENAT